MLIKKRTDFYLSFKAMKRCFFLFLFCATLLQIEAQKRPMWGVRMAYGESGATAHGNGAVPAFQIGATVEFPLRRTVGLQTGLSYASRGVSWRVENAVPGFGIDRLRFRSHGIHVPLFLTYHLPVDVPDNAWGFASSYFTLKVGPYIDCGLSARLKQHANESWQRVPGNPYRRSYSYADFSFSSSSVTDTYLHKLNRFEVGVSVGVDVLALGILNVSLEGGYGLTPLTKWIEGKESHTFFIQGGVWVPLFPSDN